MFLGQTLKIETYGLGFEKTYEFRSAQKTWPRSGGPRGDRQLGACSRRPSSGLGLLRLLVEEDPVRSPPKLTGTGVPFQADGVAPVLAGLDGLHEAFAGAARLAFGLVVVGPGGGAEVGEELEGLAVLGAAHLAHRHLGESLSGSSVSRRDAGSRFRAPKAQVDKILEPGLGVDDA